MLLSTAKKLIILFVGSSVILIGAAMLILPGPAFIVIPLGLAILGTEFAWAKRVLNRLRDRVSSLRTTHRDNP